MGNQMGSFSCGAKNWRGHRITPTGQVPCPEGGLCEAPFLLTTWHFCPKDPECTGSLNISFVPVKSCSSEHKLMKHPVNTFQWSPLQPAFWPQVKASFATFWDENSLSLSPCSQQAGCCASVSASDTALWSLKKSLMPGSVRAALGWP